MTYDPTPEELAELLRRHENTYVYAPTDEMLDAYRLWALQRLRAESE